MINELFNLQNKSKIDLKSTTAKDRIIKLDRLQKWILKNRNEIKTALYNDFKKPLEETDLSEIYPVLAEIKYAKNHLAKWMKIRQAKRTLTLFSHSAYTNYEAKGIVLIISPWNFPFMLTITPLVSAIAAGNSVIIKPSEVSVNTSEFLSKMISELFSEKEVAVVQGNKDIVTELLSFPFDHIFFTGSTEVGRIIAKSAAANLTSCTLELGGKSPVIIDETADLRSAAEKIVWGKFLNKGQTCVAPDYVLVKINVREKFTDLLIENINKFYEINKNPIELSPGYARVINGHHHSRLVELVDNAISNGSSILYGGNHDKNNRFIEPTIILTNCTNCKISEDEIFGPLLPIVEFEEIGEAIEWINNKTSALAIYIFSKNKTVIKKIEAFTQSGGIGINEVVLQFSHQHLPFGGVRHSGIGRSHGFAGFQTFSNERSYIKSGRINFLKILYPPYTKRKKKLIDFLLKYL